MADAERGVSAGEMVMNATIPGITSEVQRVASSGGTLTLTAGQYAVRATVRASSCFALVGEGAGTTQVVMHHDGLAFQLEPVSAVLELRDLDIDWNSPSR